MIEAYYCIKRLARNVIRFYPKYQVRENKTEIKAEESTEDVYARKMLGLTKKSIRTRTMTNKYWSTERKKVCGVITKLERK